MSLQQPRVVVVPVACAVAGFLAGAWLFARPAVTPAAPARVTSSSSSSPSSPSSSSSSSPSSSPPSSLADARRLQEIDRRLSAMEQAERSRMARIEELLAGAAAGPAAAGAAAAGDAAGKRTAAASPPGDRAEAAARANDVVNSGLARGRWTEADRTKLRSLLPSLGQADVDEIARTLADAVNHDALVIEGRSLL